MESNSIYVTKKEFYSVTTGIFALVMLTVVFSNEPAWRRCFMSFALGINLFFYFYKFLKEKSKSASSGRADK